MKQSMADTKYVLEMIGISKSFPGVKALDKVQLKVRPGTVHALMGENGAGKSTLMKCLFGVYIEDEGDIYINGVKSNFINPKQAMDNGVAMVHQELNQVLQRNVMDNIWLGRYPSKGGVINEKIMYDETKKIFDELEINVDPRTKMAKLSVSERQMVEIAKAVSYNAKILVLDEPTSSLAEQEVRHLFRIINKLRKKGCGMIYISHKMEEILEISDDVTIMRDGKWIDTIEAKNLTTDKIIKLMVGRDLTNRFPPKTNKPGEVILEVNNLTGAYEPAVKDASFKLRKGEILGVAGLVGSRRTELLETIFGIRSKASGEVKLHGNLVNNSTSRQAIKNGFALLTEERRATGIFGQLDIKFNTMIANIDGYSKFGVLDNKKMTEDTKWTIDSMKVKTPSQKTAIRTLSGGNQQKVIVAKVLNSDLKVVILDEPTKGVDVGAKAQIYEIMSELAAQGFGVIMISSEMPEVLGMADTILVMKEGRVSKIFADATGVTQEQILEAAMNM